MNILFAARGSLERIKSTGHVFQILLEASPDLNFKSFYIIMESFVKEALEYMLKQAEASPDGMEYINGTSTKTNGVTNEVTNTDTKSRKRKRKSTKQPNGRDDSLPGIVVLDSHHGPIFDSDGSLCFAITQGRTDIHTVRILGECKIYDDDVMAQEVARGTPGTPECPESMSQWTIQKRFNA